MQLVIGIDEVGRGAWAGPLVVAAVALTGEVPGLADSKAVTKAKRLELADEIKANSIYNLSWIESEFLDKVGLAQALKIGVLNVVKPFLEESYKTIIIDGNINYLNHLPNTKAVIKADQTIACVSAASIVAKVERDDFMAKISEQYPNYDFANNVGYGTKKHQLGLINFGVTPLHRKSFKPIKKYL